jgi:release factor glutamine methyltransferase
VAEAAHIAPGDLLTALDTAVSPRIVDAAAAMVDRRAAGEPLQYVLGTWSFRQLEVRIDQRALIPRPETEQVVEVALEMLRHRLAGGSDRRVVVDLGTGSGVIALSLAVESDDVEVWAIDVSGAALELAAGNLASMAADHPEPASRVHLVEGAWFAALPSSLAGQVRLVVSNPPYVSEEEWSALDPEVRDHEPRLALVPGVSGLEALELLVDQARRWLAPGGGLVLELAPHQADTTVDRAETAGYVEVAVRVDLAGRARTLVAVWPGG